MIGVILLAGWLAFSYYEAETELEVLCSLFHKGQPRMEVERVLGTGEYLRFRTEAGTGGERIVAESPFNLRRTRCVVTLESGVVSGAHYE